MKSQTYKYMRILMQTFLHFLTGETSQFSLKMFILSKEISLVLTGEIDAEV